jgi:hypothetical protein
MIMRLRKIIVLINNLSLKTIHQLMTRYDKRAQYLQITQIITISHKHSSVMIILLIIDRINIPILRITAEGTGKSIRATLHQITITQTSNPCSSKTLSRR